MWWQNKKNVSILEMQMNICRKWKEELEFPMFWNWTVANIEAEDVEFVRKSKRIRLVENIKIRNEFN